MTTDWQPIETAPRNGDPIWVYVPDDYQTAVVFHRGLWKTDVRNFFGVNATHWMPLPEPPHDD